MLRNGKALIALYVSFFVICSTLSFAGTPPCDLQEITADPLRNGASFGTHALSGNGEYLVVGAPNESFGVYPQLFESAGAAYVFKKIGGSWVQQARLTASVPGNNDAFGGPLAISDDGSVLFVGAIQKDAIAPNPGKAYVFNRDGSTWTEDQIITGSTVNGASFSNSIALDGSTVVIAAKYDGSNYELHNDFRRGDIYIYTYSAATDSWEPEAHFIAPDPQRKQNFGVRVSYENGIAAIGARQANGTVDRTGAVYMYTRSMLGTWTFQQKLTETGGETYDWFGFAVDLDEDAETLVVGVPRDKVAGLPQSGSAFIYTREAGIWSLHDELVANVPGKGDNFGHRVTISRDGESVLIGAPFTDEDSENTNTGSAYYFTRGAISWTWEYIIESFGLDAGAGDLFGKSITIWSDRDARYGLISAPRTNVQDIEDSGAVYYFGLTSTACQ